MTDDDMTDDEMTDEMADDAPEFGSDPALAEVAERVRSVLRDDQLRPDFRRQLRSELVSARAALNAGQAADTETEASPRALEQQADRPGGTVLPWRRRPAAIAWAAAAAVAALLAGVLVRTGVPGLHGAGPVDVAVAGDVTGGSGAGAGGTVRLRFSTALDHAATLAALRLVPATLVRSQWLADTLILSASNGFAPNAAYVLTIDHTVARTVAGAAIARDLHVVFGTAPTLPVAGPAPAEPALLPRERVARAEDDSEAVVLSDDSVVLTGARPQPATAGHQGVVRIRDGVATKLAPATGAICLSRSGRSLAYLSGQGANAQVVVAGRSGTAQARLPVVADPGTPLGWIDDDEVVFIGDGRLRAVDRAGKIRLLSQQQIDAAAHTVVIAPGGRYVYLAAASRPGRVLDRQTGRWHQLAGIVGEPAFSMDGATAVWLAEAGGRTSLVTAASAGGPSLLAPLQLRAGDRAADLAVSPDGSRLAYSVTHPDGLAVLRLAALPSGAVLAESPAGAGSSPNWSPTARFFTVLARRHGVTEIERVTVPAATADAGAALEASAAAFADAQVSGDTGAQQALTGQDRTVPQLPGADRSTLVWVLPGPGASATARIRLTLDPTPSHPVVVQAEETVTFDSSDPDRPPKVSAVTLGPFRPAPTGPQLTHLDTDAVPGATLLTFDGDLDPGTIPAGIQLTTAQGAAVPVTTSYDAASRTVTVRARGGAVRSAVTVHVTTALHDVSGKAPPAALALRVPLARP